MFAKVNGSEAINIHNVGFIKVLATDSSPKPWSCDFYNNTGKAIARSYGFEKESECWDFARQVISDGSRRDLKEFPLLDRTSVAA